MDVRREAETTFYRFKSYKALLHAVLHDKLVRILVLGCGNSSYSTLSEDVYPYHIIIACRLRPALTRPGLIAQMYDDGYKNIGNVDVRSRYPYRLSDLASRVC